MSNRIFIIGHGQIAKHLWFRLSAMECDITFFHRNSNKDLRVTLAKERPCAVFLAISTMDNGEAALDYINSCLELRIPIITCEKGALAYHADKIKPHLNHIGWSAAVGGGTMLGPYLYGRNPEDRKVSISAVLNGTLNFIFDEARRGGKTLGEACAEARRLGYAEPGSKSDGPQELIHAEIMDVQRKACVLFNTCIAKDEFLIPKGFIKFDDGSLRKMAESASNHRMIVQLSNYSDPCEMLYEGAFSEKIGDWQINAGFAVLDGNHELLSWLPPGVNNAIQIVEGDLGKGGKYRVEGPGAGYEATTSAMLNDFAKLTKKKYHTK